MLCIPSCPPTGGEIMRESLSSGHDIRSFFTRSLVILTIACLILCLAPSVDADDTSDLQTAINNTSENGTLELSGNYTISGPVTVSKAITIDGTSAKYTITGSNNSNVFNITSGDVVLKNLTINSSGTGIAVNSTGDSLTVSDCVISSSERGINFKTTAASDASLTVQNTQVTNPDAETTYGVDYGADNRGIAINDVRAGQVSISGCTVTGFKYGINAVISTDVCPTGPRDANGTVYNITNTTVLGWAALNITSADSTFNVTNCTFTGVNKFAYESGSNDYATINANDVMYAGTSGNNTTVNIYGGTITAISYSTCYQAIVYIDYYGYTDYNFMTNGGAKIQVITMGTQGYATVFLTQFNSPIDVNQYINDSGFNENVLYRPISASTSN